MDSARSEGKDTRRKSRPPQKLYVPPAQRNKEKTAKDNSEMHKATSNMDPVDALTDANQGKSASDNTTTKDEQSLVIMLEDMKIEEGSKNIDVDKEEMERAIVNINRKSRPLIKHVHVGNKDVLHITIDSNQKRSDSVKKVKGELLGEQVANWEDLLNQDDDCSGEVTERIRDLDIKIDDREGDSSDEEEYPKKNTGENDLDHVIELYDFPSSFKTQDLIQLYRDVNNELMYIKWCDETHALLVLSTPNQAKRALTIQHAIIKSRCMQDASAVALQVAYRADLKPAMKRPQTNMQTARRLINNHLGTKSKLSKEEHAREREELRKAKELKRALKQSENDAWDGHPRPSTA